MAANRRAVRFGVFEVDLEAGELHKSGLKVHLQEQPFQVLAVLLERAGEVVSREELIQKLWPDGTFVEFDRSLNIAVNKIREALGDSATSPRFVETVPRRGYRFVAPVEVLGASPAEPEPPVPRPRRWSRRPTAWTTAVIVVIAAAGFFVWQWYTSAPRTVLTTVPLTSYPGDESYPSFSPTGDEVTFSWNGEREDNYDIYRKPIGGGETLLRLTENPAQDYSPAWSPDGHWIAFLRQIEGRRANVVLVPALQGPERTVGEINDGQLGPVHPPSHKLAWTSDSGRLVVPDIDPETQSRGLFLLSVDTGEKRRLTTGYDVGPALSPDGRALAFCQTLAYGISDVYVVRLSGNLEPEGEPRRISGDVRATASPAWTPDGEEVVFVGSGRGVRTLWAASANGCGTPRRLAVGEGADFPAFVRSGNRLVYSRREDPRWNLLRLDLAGSDGQPAAPSRFAPSTRGEIWPMFSPDGRRVAFQSARSGLHQVWVCDSDGTMLRQLTFFEQGLTGSPRWSPDGGRIAFDSSAEGQFEIYVVGAEGGQPRRLTNHPGGDSVPSWSRDGKWVYFFSNRSGQGELWKVAAEGGQPIQVVTGVGWTIAQESPDGKWLYYLRSAAIWRVPAEGGPEITVVPVWSGRIFHVVDRGIYFVPPAEQGSYSIQFLDFDTGVTRRIADLRSGVSETGFSVSPDERSFLYTRTVNPQGDLMLVDDFR